MRLIVEQIFPRSGNFTSIEIVIGQDRVLSSHLAEQLFITIQRRIETRFEELLRCGRRRFKAQHSQRADLRDNAHKEGEKPFL